MRMYYRDTECTFNQFLSAILAESAHYHPDTGVRLIAVLANAYASNTNPNDSLPIQTLRNNAVVISSITNQQCRVGV